MYLAYARISHDPNNTAEGVDRQIADNERLAEQLAWSPIDHLVDNGRSAWQKRGRRPAWEDMLTRIERGEVEGVIVWHLDRLLRRADDLERLINIIEANPIPIKSAHGDIDLSTPEGRFTARILVSVAQKSSDDASRRLVRAFQDLDRTKIHPAYGHSEAQRPHLHYMAEQYIGGATSTRIAKTLTERGVPTSQGASPTWKPQSVIAILRNPRIEGNMPAEMFVSLQRELTARDRTGTRSMADAYPLSRLLICPCGGHMWGSANGGVRRYQCSVQQCRKSVGPAEKVEESVIDAIVELTTDSQMTDPAPLGMSDVLQDRLDQLQDDYYVHGVLTIDRYRELRAAILAQAENESVAQQARTKPFPVGDRFRSEWEKGTPAQRAQLVHRAIEKIELADVQRGVKFHPSRLKIHTRARR